MVGKYFPPCLPLATWNGMWKLTPWKQSCFKTTILLATILHTKTNCFAQRVYDMELFAQEKQNLTHIQASKNLKTRILSWYYRTSHLNMNTQCTRRKYSFAISKAHIVILSNFTPKCTMHTKQIFVCHIIVAQLFHLIWKLFCCWTTLIHLHEKTFMVTTADHSTWFMLSKFMYELLTIFTSH